MYFTLVFLHVLGVIVFALGHGTSVAVAFTLRRERERPRIAAMLDVSSWSTSIMYLGLLVIIATGIALGFLGAHWNNWWLWLSIGLLVAVLGAMYSIATPYYRRVRAAAGATMDERAQKRVGEFDASAVIASLTSAARPVALTLIGLIGLAVILWLMMAQPR